MKVDVDAFVALGGISVSNSGRTGGNSIREFDTRENLAPRDAYESCNKQSFRSGQAGGRDQMTMQRLRIL